MACTAQDKECHQALHHDQGTAGSPTILPLLGGIDCKELKRAVVVSFAKQIEQEHGRETADRCLMVVRQVLNYAADYGHIEANVASGIKPDSIFKRDTTTTYKLTTLVYHSKNCRNY